MNNEKIGLFIKEQRNKLDLTQQDIADKLHVTRENISKWERGIAIPASEYLKELSNILNVSISEILSGEIAENQEDQSNKVICNIIDQSKLKRKRIIINFLIIITFLILSFFIYYFIQNYNSIKVYTISGESENYDIENSLLMVSRKKIYIDINNIISLHNNEITNISLLYRKGNKDNLIISLKKTPIVVINNEGYDEYINYENINNVINNLFIKVETNKESEIIKLNFKKDFSNDLVKESYIVDGNQSIESLLPNYINKEYFKDFTYDAENNYLIKEYKENDIEYRITYNVNNGDINVKIKKNKKNKEYTFYQETGTVSYLLNKKVMDTYDTKKNNHIQIKNEKAKKEIEYFLENYYNIIYKKGT